ncbi:hypothetical protein NIES2101_38485 [Calothrix sp. HK-06]|nr:hypothetical protein NIES2101_38485 [Calothrix sp. HK-06]
MSRENDFDSSMKEPQWISGKDFLAQGEAEYKERLQNGFTINDMKVFFQKSDFTIQFRGTGTGLVSYEVDLLDCNNSNGLLFWILHLKTKSYEPGLIYAFLTILDDACYDVFGLAARALYQYGNTLDWKNGTYREADNKE